MEDDDNQCAPDQDAETKSLATNLAGQDKWRLAESLLWIGLRDLQAVAARLAVWTKHLGNSSSGATLRTVRRSLEIQEADEQSPVFDTAPDETLRLTLLADKVHATGFLCGEGARAPFPAEEWADLVFEDGPTEFAEDACACMRPPASSRRFWTGLRFDRREMQACFCAEKPSWLVRDNENQKGWVCREDVWSEARRSVGPQAKLARVYEALEVMARDSGKAWRAKALGAARRAHRQGE